MYVVRCVCLLFGWCCGVFCSVCSRGNLLCHIKPVNTHLHLGHKISTLAPNYKQTYHTSNIQKTTSPYGLSKTHRPPPCNFGKSKYIFLQNGQVFQPILRVTDFTAGILATSFSWIGQLFFSQRQLLKIGRKARLPCQNLPDHRTTHCPLMKTENQICE